MIQGYQITVGVHQKCREKVVTFFKKHIPGTCMVYVRPKSATKRTELVAGVVHEDNGVSDYINFGIPPNTLHLPNFLQYVAPYVTHAFNAPLIHHCTQDDGEEEPWYKGHPGVAYHP